MLLTLIGKETINKLILPKEVMGNYWLCDKDTGAKLINVQNVNNKWQIQSTYRYKIINSKNVVIQDNKIGIYESGREILESIELEEYNFYYIKREENKKIYVLYCSPVYEDNYTHLHIKNMSSISIGKDQKSNHITYDNRLMNKIQAKLYFLNGTWWIKNYDTKFNTYVNNEPVSDTSKMLNNGDRIFMFGLTIIIIDKELFINNPLNKVSYDKGYFTLCNHLNNKLIKFEDEDDFRKYVNQDYFFRTPRMLEFPENTEISILPPIHSTKNRELPLALVLGSSFSMGAMTLISTIQAIDNFNSGKGNVKSLIFSLSMSGIMLLTSILIPLLNRKYSKKIKILNEQDTINKYEKYIKSKSRMIDDIMHKESEILYKTYITPEECVDIIINNKPRLWERKISDNDFLTVRLGVGDVKSNIKLSYAKDESTEESNKTQELMEECVKKAKFLKNVPVLLSFIQKKVVAILYNREELKYRYIQNLLLQLITFQSYDELKLVFFVKDNINKEWDFVKMMPYIWSNSKEMRFFADDINSKDELAQYLENELKKRTKEEDNDKNQKNAYITNKPYYLIIIDDYKNVEELDVINEILKEERNIGFSILFLTNSILKLPNECETFINIEEGSGVMFESKNPSENKTSFKISTAETFFFGKINQVLSDISIKINEEKESQLPSSYTFLEMYNAGCIEQLNILERWRSHDSTISLSAPIGVDGSGKIISLDIHEKFHGPHGLIAGSTGSGKSEFIITYILSLAVNYHPDDVTFVLIDYKGGGLAGAFERPDVQLPHLVGTITNIDKSSLQRSLESIESELKRRQVEFNEAKFVTGESTIDIYKYQKYYHNGILKKPISHLFIICDEFAELKQQEPEFMDELISVARIGRSLGVHLILATQKPSGVVNDQIRSNSKFGVCLKVQSTADSKDIVDIPDAAKLKGAGQFYFKVGNDDYLALGQSAWAGALYYPSNEVRKNFDNSIEFISSTGRILKKVDDDKKNSSESKGEQLTNIVKFICDLAKKENIKEEPLWLSPMPDTIYLNDLRKKYKVKNEEGIINPVIGEYDDPSRQLQNVKTLNLTSGGNTIIYGNASSGKETLISTMVYDIITNYKAEEVEIYILDFGSETMKIFKDSPHVGDVLFANEAEKIARFIMMLRKELKDRKQILSDYNGDYNLYKKKTNKVMPTIVVILNNYEVFSENYADTYDDVLEILLREGTKYGFVFVFTTGTTNGIRYRTAQNFRQRIVLQMNKDSDYSSIFDYLGKKRPARIFGRGLINPEEKTYYEFQTAKICKDEEWNEKIIETIEELNSKATLRTKEIAVVPELVTINHLASYLKGIDELPIGISNKNITPCLIDLQKNLFTPMLTNDLEEYGKFISCLIDELKMLKDINVIVLDAEQIIDDKDNVREKYLETFKKMNGMKKIKTTIFVIIGLDKFISQIEDDDVFLASLKNAEFLQKCHYILFDSLSKFNNHTYAEWFKKYGSDSDGVWLGNGVNEQYLLKPTSSAYKMSNMCGISYGYVFKKGKPSLTKLLGMKESSEENE